MKYSIVGIQIIIGINLINNLNDKQYENNEKLWNDCLRGNGIG